MTDQRAELLDLGDGLTVLQFQGGTESNAFDKELLDAMTSCIDTVASAPPRALLIETPRANFAAGADLKDFLELSEEAYVEYIESEYSLFERVERLRFVTLAAIKGTCLGNAAELALCCDVRVAADNLLFGYPETTVAFIAPTQRVSRFVGIGVAKELLMGGRLVKAEEAKELGLVNEVAAVDDLEERARAVGKRWARRAPVALEITKEALRSAYARESALNAFEQRGALRTFQTDDFREGASAVLEKRKPEFRGK